MNLLSQYQVCIKFHVPDGSQFKWPVPTKIITIVDESGTSKGKTEKDKEIRTLILLRALLGSPGFGVLYISSQVS